MTTVDDPARVLPRKEAVTQTRPTYLARCRCGAIEVGAWGEPIIVTACYCDDCQAAAQLLAAAPDSAPVASSDGGTEFMLFRRDRIACARGGGGLRAMKLTDASKTRRMVAGCCATPMYLAFDDKRPWVSAFRVGFGSGAPPVAIRICTRFRQSPAKVEDDVPSHPGYPPALMVRILVAWLPMLFSYPVGVLP